MLLLLMRHGIAEDSGKDSDESDARRALTQRGMDKVRGMGEALKQCGYKPTHYCSSPRLRAEQTARLVAEVFGKSKVHTVDSLDFDGDWSGLVKELREVTGEDEKAVVLAASHQPNCGKYVTEALTGTSLGMEFKKAAVAGIEWNGPIDETGGRLVFYWTFGMVKKMG